MGYNSIAQIGVGGAVGGAEQQSFLGATIQGFSVTAGFGDSASQLTVKLIHDGSFTSDNTPLDQGVDVYHGTTGDLFRPPPVGTPVFFTFGKIRATVAEGFARTIDDYYGTAFSSSYAGGKTVWNQDKNSPNYGKYISGNKGYHNFSFGGLLQSYNQTQTSTDGLQYSVTVVDPREILSNCVLILNHYTGTTFGNNNLINIHGFLEHNASDVELRKKNDPEDSAYKANKSILNPAGIGMDVFLANLATPKPTTENFAIYKRLLSDFQGGHPMTGTGMSRRTSSGIPYYRVVQAMNYLSGTGVHSEYQKYSGGIYFRGLSYALDLSALPILPKTYMLDYDNLSILDYCQEVCEAANYELFFTLLPIVPETATGGISPSYAGVIKVITVNKNFDVPPGSIAGYIDSLPDELPVTNLEIGYELTNEPTDKVVTGGKECSMYYFPTPYGGPDHGMHHYSSNKPIIPFYGFLGKRIPTIPRGVGTYSQIILDAGSLNAYGVGKYYVTTEIELRAASVSFEKWSEFLLMYNSTFMESIENNDISDLYYAYNTAGQGRSIDLSNNYQVTVPRCVWPPHSSEDGFDTNGEPKNPCSPPYGWPLYWHRALNIGLPRAGAVGVSAMAAQVIEQEDYMISEDIKNFGSSSTGAGKAGALGESQSNGGGTTGKNRGSINNRNAVIASAISTKLGKTGLVNAKIVYNFVKKVADECLGKKYLVQIPQKANEQWSANTLTALPTNNWTGLGPYGFPPMRSGSIGGYAPSDPTSFTAGNLITRYFSPVGPTTGYGQTGALTANIHAPTSQVKYNYIPSTAGGYYGYYGAPTLSQRRSFLLEPYDNNFIRGDDGRTKCYARFSHSEALVLANFPKDSFAVQYLNYQGNGYIPALGVGIDIQEQSREFNESVTFRGQSFLPQGQVAFVKAELDPDLYSAPPTTNRSTLLTGNNFKWTNVDLPPRKIFDTTLCEEVETYAVVARKYEPVASTANKISINTIDLDYLWDSTDEDGWSRNGVYALITLPERAIPSKNSAFRDGMNMQVNAGNIYHYLQKDIVRGMPGLQNQAPVRPISSAISQIYDLKDQNIPGATPGDPIGLAFRRSAQQAVRKAYQGLTFDLTNRISIISPSPVVPDLVAIPLESQERNYGPWTSVFEAYGQIGGKMDYVHDENLTPWTYGSYSLMDKAGKLKAEFGTSAKLMSEKGSFSYPFWPSGLTIGAALAGGGPLVSDISLSVDANGVSTSVVMNTYTQSFGKLQKQRQDQLNKLTRQKQKIDDINNHLVRRNIGKGQDNASFKNAIDDIKHLLTSQDFSNRMYNSYEQGKSEGSEVITLGRNAFPTSNNQNTSLDNLAGSDVDLRNTNSMQSQGAYAYMAGLLSENPVQSAMNYQNAASESLSNLFAPVSAGYHQTMSSSPPMRKPDQASYNDTYGDQDVSTYDTSN